MGEWREYKISDIATLVKNSWKVGDEKLPYLGLEHIEEAKLRLNGIGSSDDVASNKYRFSSGDVLFGKLRPYFRKVVKPNFNGICSTDIWVLNTTKKSDINFLFYFFANQELINLSYSSSSGTRMPRADWKFLSQTLWDIPPLKEQKAIAEVLSSLDDKIDLLHRQNRTLEEIAQTLFRQWFIEEAKDEWEVVSLDDILTITSSKRVFYSEYVSSGIPFYRSKEIIELHNTGQTKGELFISEERYNEIVEKSGAINHGDILLTSVGTLGIPYRVNKDDKFYFKDGNLTWFKDFTKLPSLIILYWLKSDIGKEQLDAVSIGSTQSALTIKSLKSIQLALPPSNIINKLEDQLIMIDDKLQANLKQIKTLENTRDTLLPKLMSGEVRIKDE